MPLQTSWPLGFRFARSAYGDPRAYQLPMDKPQNNFQVINETEMLGQHVVIRVGKKGGAQDK